MMKLEKRSDGQGEPNPDRQPETAPTGKKPVVVYIMILFIAAFLLMALSFFMHQRSNTEALGELQHSVTAMQEVQATQEKIIELQEELAQVQEDQQDLKETEQDLQQELDDAQAREQALLGLYTLQQQYAAGDLDACRATIGEMESAGYDRLLSNEAPEEGVTSPAQRFEELRQAVEGQAG
ncbi:hypothetical protein [Dysosmobacter sp.]|jgi:Sec-independent protein translocase protein TatA|uniref:hypothetical protein n=1 Tax=Dysosmobacter sp. TaxID=2591382 RepID=UPI003AB6A5A3